MVYQIKIEDLFKHFRKDERSWNQVKETSLLKDAQIRQKMKCKIEPGHTVLRKKDAYFGILDRYQVKKTSTRVNHFRETIKEIVDAKMVETKPKKVIKPTIEIDFKSPKSPLRF